MAARRTPIRSAIARGALPSRRGIGNQEPATSATLRQLLKCCHADPRAEKAQICAAEAQKWPGRPGDGRYFVAKFGTSF
jgi:hypothetical protein